MGCSTEFCYSSVQILLNVTSLYMLNMEIKTSFLVSVNRFQVGRESQHAETTEDPSEEAVPDCKGQSPPPGGAQQSYSCPKQAGEFVSRTTETQQDIKGTNSAFDFNI